MPLQPVNRRSVPDEVFDQVLAEVVDGEIGAGESLPSERRLAEVLGVSRPAVREALQRMTQSRLVEVRHGGATTVRDFQRSAGLDLLPQLLVRRGELDPTVARSVLEARLAIGPSVAALAAERGGPALAAPLTDSVDALAGDRRRRRAAAARPGVLGPRGRRGRLARLPADVQQPARGLRARAGGAGPGDGRGGRPVRGLPAAHRRHRAPATPTPPAPPPTAYCARPPTA